MDWITLIECIGCLCMGFFVSWVAFIFFNHGTSFSGTEFGTFMGVIFGGTIITIFTSYLTNQNQWIYWIYPVGLVFGMIVYIFIDYRMKKNEANRGNAGVPNTVVRKMFGK
ncbi:MAG: hypothetical protein WCK53_13680 [Methanomicrobiales archaeon]